MTTLVDVPIRFDIPDGVTHAPMIDVRIGGVEARLILDTGSTDHVLTIDLVRQAGLPAVPGEAGTDHAGASVESWTVGDVPVTIDGAGFDLHDVVAIDGPAPFAGWRIGGFLSPQHLHPAATAVIDLVADRLIVVDRPIDPWPRDRYPDLTVLDLERSLDEATPVIQAAIDPFPVVPTMLNTGGRGTEFAAWAVPGLRGRTDPEPGHGVGGAAVVGTTVEDRALLVDGTRHPIDRLLVRDRIEALGGLIGMDVLRGTVLVVSADRGRRVRWLVPADRR